MSYNALVNQHTSHLIMVSLAGVQSREYFRDILHVFTPMMAVKYDGIFVYYQKGKGEKKCQKT